MMRERICELELFLRLYPKGMYILIAGLVIAALVAMYGGHQVNEYLSSSSSSILKQAIAPLLQSIYERRVLAILLVATVASVRQLIADGKRFRAR